MNPIANYFCIALFTVSLLARGVFGVWPEDAEPLAQAAKGIVFSNVKEKTLRSDVPFLYNFYRKNDGDIQRTVDNLGSFSQVLNINHELFVGAKSTANVKTFKQNIVRLLAGNIDGSPVLVLKIANWAKGGMDKIVLATSFVTQEVAKLEATIANGAMLILDAAGLKGWDGYQTLEIIPVLQKVEAVMFPLPIKLAYVINLPEGKNGVNITQDNFGKFAAAIAKSTFIVNAAHPLPAEVENILPPSHFKTGKAAEATAFNSDIIEYLSTTEVNYNQYCFTT